jgi:hypothetical protein
MAHALPKEVTDMEVKPMAQAPVVMPVPAPAPILPMAPVMEKPHDHIHLHASYKHTAIVLPEVKPIVHHVPVAPVVAPTSTASILVLFILLVIIARSFSFGVRC